VAEESVVILVTGGCGYIGSKLIRDLATDEKLAGSTIRILDSMLRERYVAIMDLPSQGDYEFLEGDIRKEDDLDKAFRDVDTVVDLAGITNAPLSFERKELTFEVNVSGGRKVVDYAVKRGVERFIYSSTASVYGPTKGVVDETVQCKPISPYGESKLQAEKFCLDASRTSGMSSTVLRLGTVYGYSIGMRFDTVVDRFVYLACAGMPLTVWESAQQEKRPYLHLQDSCRVIIHALKQMGMKGQTYNVVGENATINRITNAIAKEVPDVEVIVTPTPNLNQVSYELDASRIAKLGFHPQHDLEGGVREIVDRFRGLLKKRRPISIGREPIPPLPELRDA
jgi:UDP-glucose 4-epimerase